MIQSSRREISCYFKIYGSFFSRIITEFLHQGLLLKGTEDPITRKMQMIALHLTQAQERPQMPMTQFDCCFFCVLPFSICCFFFGQRFCALRTQRLRADLCFRCFPSLINGREK